MAISCAPILHSGDSPIDVDFTRLLESCSAKRMKSRPCKDDALLHKLIQSARSNGDSKSVFGVLLLIERKIRSEEQRNTSQATPPESENLQNGGLGLPSLKDASSSLSWPWETGERPT
jgi:hypothetical protein